MELPRTPTISAIIPCKPGQWPAAAIAALAQVRYPLDKIEILVAKGYNPSAQRNRAAEAAQGELLQFLDDDAAVHPFLFHAVLDAYEQFPDASGVGGPSLPSLLDTSFQLAVGAAMGSAFGLGPARHRYTPRGLIRYATERDLILCNLNLRRDVFLNAGGFDPRLYPNEENELVDRFKESGVRLLHHPLAVVFRGQRRSLAAVFTQNFNYGRGRLDQFWYRPRSIDMVYAAPLLLCLYLVGALLVSRWYAALPFALYAVLGLSAALLSAVEMRRPATFAWLVLLYPVMHLAYGLGMAWGLLKRLARKRRRNTAEVEIIKVKGFGERLEVA